MVPFVSGDPEYDFWEQNPELKILSPFDDLYKDKDGSKLMWAIYLWRDPKSPWNRLGVKDRKLEIEENYLKGKVDLDDLSFYAREYELKCLSISERDYLNMSKAVQEFSEQYHKLSWKDDTKEKMNLLDRWDKIHKQLKEAEATAHEEYLYQVEGNRTESLIETGEI